MKRYLVILLAAAATSVAGARVFAHHSFSATYQEDQSVTIEGELVQFMFRNPHSFVNVNVKQKMVPWCGTQLNGVAQVSSEAKASAEKRSSPVTLWSSPGAQAGTRPKTVCAWSACVARRTASAGACVKAKSSISAEGGRPENSRNISREDLSVDSSVNHDGHDGANCLS